MSRPRLPAVGTTSAVVLDERNLIVHAGLIPAMIPAEQPGLSDLVR